MPALWVIAWAGEGKAVELLLWSQVVLSLQLGFACWPLVRITSDVKVMREYIAPRWVIALGWAATFVIVSASIWFVSNAI